MRTRSLEQRLALGQQVLAGVLIVAFAAAAIGLTARTLERQERAFLGATLSHLVEGLNREWTEENDLGRAAQALIEEAVPPGVQLEILDASGRRVRANFSVVSQPARGEVASKRAYLARGAWVVVSVDSGLRRDAVTALGMALLLTGVPLFLLVTVSSRSLARRLLRPLSGMARAAESATHEGVVRPLGERSDPEEIAVLAGAFNRLLQRLEQTLEAERNFTQDAAHELRTPLTVVSGELEYALAHTPAEDRRHAGLERAAEQVRTMSALVEALLFLKRADPAGAAAALGTSPVNLADVVRDTWLEFAERVRPRLPDVSLSGADEVLVAGHAVLIASAVHNLIGNALKFTQPGQAIRISVALAGSSGVVCVDDAGRGIPPEDRERVFQPFYRDPEARAETEGSGLGLAILRRVARAHGGDVTIGESTLGGARFELSLPAWPAQR